MDVDLRSFYTLQPYSVTRESCSQSSLAKLEMSKFLKGKYVKIDPENNCTYLVSKESTENGRSCNFNKIDENLEKIK